MWDHNKDLILKRVFDEASINPSLSGIDGFSFHWYTGDHFENIELTHCAFPNKLLFHTEGCFSFDPTNSFANQYAHDSIEDLNAGVNGYMDWNILLDSKGRTKSQKKLLQQSCDAK